MWMGMFGAQALASMYRFSGLIIDGRVGNVVLRMD